MKIRQLAGLLVLSACLGAQAADEVQLEVSAERTLNIRNGTLGVNAYLAPVGPLESRVRAGRVTISHALDDTGVLLTQQGTNTFYSVSVGRIDDSKDLTSREPTPFSLWGLSKDAKALKFVSGVLELVIPDLDPGSTVVVGNVAARYGAPISSDVLSKAGVTLTVFNRTSATAAAEARTPGGPQDFDSGTLFGSHPHLPAGFPNPGMEDGDIAVAIDDPGDRLLGVEIQAADGSPLRYDHGGWYHSSGLTGSPGRRFDIYHLGSDVPADARLVCWVITPTSLLKMPFHIDTLPLPDAAAGRRRLGMMTVRVDLAASRTRDTLKYEDASSETKVTQSAPGSHAKIVALWADVPEYAAILKRDISYKKAPKLLSSVPPELPPGAPLPPHTTVKVLVSFVVDDQGNVEAARALESDDPRFNMSAVEAVLRWKFRPAETDEGPTMIFITIPFIFNAPNPETAKPGAPPG
jgi:TonB family protein